MRRKVNYTEDNPMVKFFRKLGLRTKLYIGFAAATLFVVFYFLLRGKIDLRQILKYELSKAETEREIEYLNQYAEENVDKVKDLDKKEEAIKQRMEKIKSEEAPKAVSISELDKFFKERGF